MNFHTVFQADGLTGGGTALDGVSPLELADGDVAVVKISGAQNKYDFFIYDELSTAQAVITGGRLVIKPKNIGLGAGRWFQFVPGRGEYTSRTVSLDNSMSGADINSAIDNVGKYIHSGVTVTFQFADGTYNLTEDLDFKYFYGGGDIEIFGDTGEAGAETLHTSQDVFLDFSGGSSDGLSLWYNTNTYISVKNLKIKTDGNTAIYSRYSSAFIEVFYSYLLGTGTAAGNGILFRDGSWGWAKKNYFDNLQRAIYMLYGICYSDTNDDTGTSPAYGLYSDYASRIHKNSTQPAGSTANEFKARGSWITSGWKDGAWP